MNRLQHFMRSTTAYGLHSPFVYRLYTEVLFSRSLRRAACRFDDIVSRLEYHYGVSADDNRLLTPDGEFFIVDHPHRQEALWQSICDDPHYQVTIDLFDVGIAVSNPRLSRQHFLLH